MSVESDVAKVIANWDEGLLAHGEVLGRFLDLLSATNIDEVVLAVPDEWRGDFIQYLQSISRDGRMLRILGGVYRYELESDPILRSEMQSLVGREQDAEELRFESTVRPAIREWVRGHA